MAKRSQDDVKAEIVGKLDVLACYREMGVAFAGKPRSSGKIECYAAGREEKKPSAYVDLSTGYYGDSGANGGKGDSLSIFDFAVTYGGIPGVTDFRSALKHFAAKAGVTLGQKKSDDWTEQLEFLDWTPGHETLVKIWSLKHKPGTSLEAIRAAGGRIAYYPCYRDKDTDEKKSGKYKVIALPCFRPGSMTPVAWVLWNIAGQLMEVYRGKGKLPDFVKMKSIGPTSGTLMNQSAVERLTPERYDEPFVLKTEGPSDMLAAMTAAATSPAPSSPAPVITCNASGSTGDIPRDVASLFAGRKLVVIHDADKAGELGAAKWTSEVAGCAGEFRNPKLPYEIVEKHGPDLRQWFTEGHTWSELISLIEQTRPFAVAAPPRPAGAQVDPSSPPPAEPAPGDDTKTLFERSIVKVLGLDVLGELEGGGVKVFSVYHRKSHVIDNVSRLSFEELLQICGPEVKVHVVRGDPETTDTFGLQNVRDSIALLAGYKRIGDQTELGPGCWQGRMECGELHQSVVLVGAGEAAEINGSGTLERIIHPRCKGHLLDFDSGTEPWYDFATVRRHLAECDRGFSAAVFQEATQLFSRWRWRHQQSAPVVLAGLAIATWVQTLWDWRPQVAIIGASQAGKTTLFNALTGMFGTLAKKSSGSTAAGIRQAIQTSARPIFCDEFENNRHRQETLDMLRASGRGDKILRGTTNQRGAEFTLRHIAWVAAIEVALKREPDQNRFITLELIKPPTAEHGNLVLPSHTELGDLGQRMLAVSIRHVHGAKALAASLRGCKFPGINSRIVESYSVPAAMLSAMQGYSVHEATEVLAEMLTGVDQGSAELVDEADLMHAILSVQLPFGRDNMTVAQLLEIVIHHTKNDWESAEQVLAANGLKMGFYGQGKDIPEGLRGQACLVISHQVVNDNLLKFTKWKEQSIEQILRRMETAVKDQRRVGGHRNRVILVSETMLKEKFLGSPEQDKAF